MTLNVPWTELVREGEMKNEPVELDAIFFGRGVSYNKPIIVSCGSGNSSRGFVGTRDAGCAKRETVRRRME